MILNNIYRHFVHSFRKHLALLGILFLIQLVFFVLIAFVNVKYQLSITQNIQNIIVPLQQANYNDTLIQTGVPFLNNPTSLYESYTQVVLGIKYLVAYQLLAFFFVLLLAWALVHFMFDKENICSLWVRMTARASVFVFPLLLVNYLSLNAALSWAIEGGESRALLVLYVLAGLTALALYFMFVCLALPPSSLRKSIPEAFRVGVFRAHYIILAFLFEGVIIGLAGYFLVISVESWPFWAMTALLVLFVAGFVFARLFFVSVVRELSLSF